MKSWLAQGSSGRRVTLLSGTTFLHINGALLYTYEFKLQEALPVKRKTIYLLNVNKCRFAARLMFGKVEN